LNKAILFDLDGVVIDSEPLYQLGEERLFGEYGIEIPEEDWKIFRGSTEEKFYKMARERYKIQEDHDILRQKGRAYVLEEFNRSLDFMSGFKNLSERIKNDYRIGLVTATPPDIFEWLDERLHLKKIFPEILCGGMTVNGKPHPEPYLTMMDMLNTKPADCVVIEDSLHGVNAGLASGAKVIVLTGSVPVDALPKVHAVVDCLDQITNDLLNSLFSN